MCSGANAGEKLSSKVASSDQLNKIGNEEPVTSAPGTSSRDTHNNEISNHNDDQNTERSKHPVGHDGKFSEQDDASDNVIVKQPINKITIVNVTYQKELRKTSKIYHRKVSVAKGGHVTNPTNVNDVTPTEAFHHEGKNVEV